MAVVWGSIVFRISWWQSSVERTARLIIYGHPFKIEALAKLIATAEAIEQAKYGRPAALRSAAIIRLRMPDARAAAAGCRRDGDPRVRKLARQIRLGGSGDFHRTCREYEICCYCRT
jgi:hypothetical protein